jgi:hypothetical protein
VEGRFHGIVRAYLIGRARMITVHWPP